MSVASSILGIDPGLRITGWGIIRSQGSLIKHVAHGVIKPPPTLELSQRLAYIFQELLKICEQYAPSSSAIEEIFVNTNPASTLKLGAARGAAMLAPAHYGISVAEYGANHIKKAIVGKGHADKAQVQAMIKHLLPSCGDMPEDSADALAIAICHAHTSTTITRIFKERRT